MNNWNGERRRKGEDSRFNHLDGKNYRIHPECVVPIPKDAMGGIMAWCLKQKREHGRYLSFCGEDVSGEYKRIKERNRDGPAVGETPALGVLQRG
jgi:hypothetical protein